MSQPTRLIVFLELVHGCNNLECPSWGSVCRYGEQKYTTEETLLSTATSIKKTLHESNPFEVIDVWAYGCGDSLDHPNLNEMLKIVKRNFGTLGKISMAIDSRRAIPNGNWYKHLDKIKIIHKMPETFDWLKRAKLWAQLPIQMSHKLITNSITKEMWEIWKSEDCITELKAVPWHDIELGTTNPTFKKRSGITCEQGVPMKEGDYLGRPVRRVMINWDGSLRRCLVSPTEYKTIRDLLLEADKICQTCFPLTGTGLAKFFPEYVSITPSASCVSDGYFAPTWDD